MFFNHSVGELLQRDGKAYFRSRVGPACHPIYGPYEQLTPGSYVAVFDLGLSSPTGGHDPNAVCAVLEVTADGGSVYLAQRDVRPVDLGDEMTRFEVPFEVTATCVAEYRVGVIGNVPLLIEASPAAFRVEAGRRVGTPDDPCFETSSPVLLQAQVRSVMRLLKPHAVNGYTKRRFGRSGDGGYVCIDDFEGLDTAFSFGINDDISWDLDAADRGLRVYQFDHTVEDPAPDDDRFVFEKKMISPWGENTESLERLVARHDKGLARPNIFLKMDIEGGEWPLLNHTNEQALSRIAQITCEIHGFNYMEELHWRSGIFGALSRLNKVFALVHIHGNNYPGFANVANVMVPAVMEATFVNRSLYDIQETDEMFPGPLDQACDSAKPDMFLGNFRF